MMSRYLYTIDVRVEVAGENASEAMKALAHALANAKKEGVRIISTTAIDQREEDE